MMKKFMIAENFYLCKIWLKMYDNFKSSIAKSKDIKFLA